MIIIAGAGPRTEKYLLKSPKHCFRCNNSTRWVLQKTKHFVTLFFLPVVPYKTDYLMYCPICGNAIELSREEFDRQQADAEPFNG